MNTKVLSITIPTYNAEKYLKKCLDSFVIPEILDKLEILIINDGSTDSSSDIAMLYVSKYPNTFRLINKKNGGHGSGINRGIQEATGTFFKVVDADDWVRTEGMISLIRMLEQTPADIVASRFLWAYDNGEDENSFPTKEEKTIMFSELENGKAYMFDDIADKIYIKMHNMTIKTDILKSNNIYIDEHCYYVDTEFILYPIPWITTIAFSDEVVYMYRLGRSGQSMDISKMQKNVDMYDKVLKSLYKFYEKIQDGSIRCSNEKTKYIEMLIARVYAGMIKIVLSLPASSANKELLLTYETKNSNQYKKIYESNINWALNLLRKSGYRLYTLASFLAKIRYK